MSKVISFENSAEGVRIWLLWADEVTAKERKKELLLGAEPTGHYWFALAWGKH